MFKIAVLLSGSGTNLQNIIDNIKNKTLNAEIKVVISDRKNSYGITRAENEGIKTFILDRKVYKTELSDKIYEIVENEKVDLIVLAGFLSIIKGKILKTYKNKIINIHPSLIPSFCGDGMYGLKVHQEVLKYGVKITGCTVHFVDEGTDTGKIILQKPFIIDKEYTAEELQKEVLKLEYEAMREALKIVGNINSHN